MTQSPVESPKITEQLRQLTSYSRLPPRLQKKYSAEMSDDVDDTFGVTERLAAIQTVLAGKSLGRMIDLGGNSGYFSLTLVDSGMAVSSTVYDLDSKALSAGRIMARELGIDDSVQFVELPVSLKLVQGLGAVDTVICLNLIHHAGSTFDVDEVAKEGWEKYATNWLAQLRKNCKTAVVGVGFKGQKPRGWDVKPESRPRRFYEMATQCGWTVRYDANVEDIHVVGVERANGKRTRRSPRMIVDRLISKIWSGPGENAKSKMKKYHLFILD